MGFRKITNIESIRKEIKKKKLPETFRLSRCAVIFDVEKFLESHLTFLDTERLMKTKHTLYYDRLKILLDTLDINIIIEEKDE